MDNPNDRPLNSAVRALAVVIAIVAQAAFPQDASAQSGNTISVPISGLHSSIGEVRCGLFNSADTFRQPGKQFMGVATPIANQQATCTFSNVPNGTYAVAVFHAEHGETQIEYGIFGIPKEGYGFSRNPSTTWGPPNFSDADFTYSGGSVSLPVTLKY